MFHSKILSLKKNPLCFSNWIKQWVIQVLSVTRTLLWLRRGENSSENLDKGKSAEAVLSRVCWEFRGKNPSSERAREMPWGIWGLCSQREGLVVDPALLSTSQLVWKFNQEMSGHSTRLLVLPPCHCGGRGEVQGVLGRGHSSLAQTHRPRTSSDFILKTVKALGGGLVRKCLRLLWHCRCSGWGKCQSFPKGASQCLMAKGRHGRLAHRWLEFQNWVN